MMHLLNLLIANLLISAIYKNCKVHFIAYGFEIQRVKSYGRGYYILQMIFVKFICQHRHQIYSIEYRKTE